MAEHASPSHAHGHEAHHEEGWVKKYLWSTDHKIICFQYMFTGMFMALLGGFFSYVFRMQTAFPGMDVPLYVKDEFADFYRAMFQRAYERKA